MAKTVLPKQVVSYGCKLAGIMVKHKLPCCVCCQIPETTIDRFFGACYGFFGFMSLTDGTWCKHMDIGSTLYRSGMLQLLEIIQRVANTGR